jgi:hypothetical protein
MNTGQTILTIVAIVLLGTNVVSVNRTFTQHGSVLQQTEIGLFGVSLATSLVEEAQGKAFDKYSLAGFLATEAECTPVDSLGPDAGEARAAYDDFDDFNWMTGGPTRDNTVVRADTIIIKDVDTFLRWSKVCYVDSTNPNLYRSFRTFNKKLTVYVWGKSTQDTLQMSYLFSYWSFR